MVKKREWPSLRQQTEVFGEYEIPCIYCGLEFMFHITGEKGRSSFFCSDHCSSEAKRLKKESDENWHKYEYQED